MMTRDDIQAVYEAVVDPKYSHSRARNICGWVVHVYHRDETSPTGAKLAAGGDPEVVEAIIRMERDNSPLSPTEFYR